MEKYGLEAITGRQPQCSLNSGLWCDWLRGNISSVVTACLPECSQSDYGSVWVSLILCSGQNDLSLITTIEQYIEPWILGEAYLNTR